MQASPTEPSSPDARSHWAEVYASKAVDDVSWWQPEADLWIDLVEAVSPDVESRIIDVGAGSSLLVDALLDRGYSDVSVLDLAEPALENVRTRLGERPDSQGPGRGVDFICADVRSYRSAVGFDVWHDRAVLHFLTDPADVAAYRRSVLANLVPGGFAVIAVFALDGPAQCSGLTVQRYDADALVAAMGDGFTTIAQDKRIHRTPWQAEQPFTVVTLQRQQA